MTENPFDSPILDTTEYVKTPPSGPVKRPIGVSVLVVLLAIAVLICFVTGVRILAMASQVGGLGTLGVALGGVMFFLGGIILVSAIGMWTGAKWGWWLGTTGYAFSVILNGVTLVVGMSLPGGATGSLYTKHGTRAFIAVLIVAYLFQDNVLRFFRLQDWSKGKLFGVLAGIALGIYAAYFLIVLIFQMVLMANVGE